ncbi:copper transporter 1 [Actinidia rufa]|uniref:Copper transport protein n=1 Tax=Actinidia rufa TaxID=165716 RepID=A0A7J0GQY7_9ERIC|nr:copper transporter 1 [Actinidia rufa]
MDGMSGDHMHGMLPSPAAANGTAAEPMPHLHRMMMHMTFFWGTRAEILFSGWPGSDTGMYYVALVFVFALSIILEWLSHCNMVKDGPNRLRSGLIQTLIHAIRIGLAYMVMLAVMSFNAGVFLVAVAGHALGYFIFGSRAFKKTAGKTEDVSAMHY